MTSRMPALGPRGEGWVAVQVVLFVIIGSAGLVGLRANGLDDPWGPVAMAIGLAAMAAGGFVSLWGLWDLRAALTPFPRPLDGAPLIESGAYRVIRHPIYSGIILGAVGWGLFTGSVWVLVASALLFLLFAGKSRREEVWLADTHPGYGDYQRRTKRLIPRIY